MTAGREYTSLDKALRNKRVPLANDLFIKDLLHKVGVEGVYETTGHIVAVRTDGGPNLDIASGSTNGFVSEGEIVALVGEGPRREPSVQRKGLWRVVHPEDPGGRESGPLSGKPSPREHGSCPECFSLLAANGACSNPGCSRAG